MSLFQQLQRFFTGVPLDVVGSVSFLDLHEPAPLGWQVGGGAADLLLRQTATVHDILHLWRQDLGSNRVLAGSAILIVSDTVGWVNRQAVLVNRNRGECLLSPASDRGLPLFGSLKGLLCV